MIKNLGRIPKIFMKFPVSESHHNFGPHGPKDNAKLLNHFIISKEKSKKNVNGLIFVSSCHAGNSTMRISPSFPNGCS